jgi:hypothetical protein
LENPCHIPECVLSHLTTCKIEGYKAVKADFRFATYIMQNARLLQVMAICRTLDENSMGSPQFFTFYTFEALVQLFFGEA